VRFLQVGGSALLIELDGLDDVLALHAEIDRRRADGWAPSLVDVIPSERAILLDGVTERDTLAGQIGSWQVPPAPPPDGPAVEIPCRYTGDDLAAVATAWRVSPAEVAQIHTAHTYRVAFCGFSPGFAYLSGLPSRFALPRRANPRTTVPAGSVAMAGTYTGVYPRPSPGGWQIIGYTDAVLWDAAKEPPALLSPGHRVRFVDVGR
jgi:KipI family sensor histidine kinase inhibitor